MNDDANYKTVTFSRFQERQVDAALVSHIEFLNGAFATAVMQGNDDWKRHLNNELAATENALAALRSVPVK